MCDYGHCARQDKTTRLQLIVTRAPADGSCLHQFYPAFSLSLTEMLCHSSTTATSHARLT